MTTELSPNRFVAVELRVEKARRRMSNRDLAAAANISPRQLIRLLNGERAIDIDILMSLCDAMGIETHDLISTAATAYRKELGGATPAKEADVAPPNRRLFGVNPAFSSN